MLRKLRQEESEFAKVLYRNLCQRLLQRRGVLSRCARYCEERTETADLDIYLDEERDTVVEQGLESVYRTFADAGNVEDEIRAFQILDRTVVEEEHEEVLTEPEDEFEAALRKKSKSTAASCHTSPKKLMKYHGKGFTTLPSSFRATVGTVLPTSVPAESLFSAARYARRYSQESQSDERYAEHIFVRHIYLQSKPWEAFAVEHDLTKNCNIAFVE